jgi:two-component system cell cycle sensor histidine kinase/response regulator CckA
MPGGGRLDVTARRPAEAETFGFGVVPNPHSYVQISVADTGSGIPPEIIGNVFDPLFTTKRNGGTGLGLAVVHQIVINHGGAIFVESTPGAGTTFHAFFRAADGQETAAAEEVRSVPALARSARILIVDDEVAVAEGLSDVLCAEGHTIAIAGTAAEGEVSAERFRPDVALVDVGLPDGNGVDLAARLRSRYPELRVLIMSGHADASGALLDDSKIRFLQKPFTIEALLTILETFENETSR